MSVALLATLYLAAAPSGVDAGKDALQSLQGAYGATNALTARYTQSRTSALMKSPLVSEGQLAFTRAPAVLRFETPSSVIRVTDEAYEVFRKKANVVEQASLPKEAWTSLLFATFSKQMDALLERMTVVGSAKEGARRVVRLAPRTPEDRAKVRAVQVTIDEKAGQLVALAYTDSGGDEVRIELSDVKALDALPEAATALGAPADAKRVTLAE